MKESTVIGAVIVCVLLGMYASLAYTGAKKSECKMEAIRAGASIEILELCDKG
jgi:hypothetical protein